MDDCVFCNIVNKVIKSEVLFDNGSLIVIKDIFPKAPLHLLVIPKKHITSVASLGLSDAALAGEMVLTAKEMANRHGVGESGYKLIFNVGRDGGQAVGHLHLHLLGGKQLGE